jgi:GTP-binding protein
VTIRFVDRATIHVESGRGGDGCVSFRREKYVPRGGPDGGDGGRGGDVIVRVDAGKRTLLDFRYQTKFAAERGAHGSGQGKTGRDGKDQIISVPPGTLVCDAESEELLADLVRDDDQVITARGGRGGYGNARFATPTNRAPRRADPGGPSTRMTLRLELKLLADAGLVGLPNAGKSTLLSRVSAARPKIAAYPFTTLTPNLGLVRVGDFQSFLLADIPGLIEGASEGRGLGADFLRHIERCRLLIYLLDGTSLDPKRDLEMLRRELKAYHSDLTTRRHLVVWNKMDSVTDPDRLPELGEEAWRISAVTGEGLDSLIYEIYSLIEEEDDGKGD